MLPSHKSRRIPWQLPGSWKRLSMRLKGLLIRDSFNRDGLKRRSDPAALGPPLSNASAKTPPKRLYCAFSARFRAACSHIVRSIPDPG
jgi:hypothetical protein